MTAISGNIANFYAQKGLPLRISKANINAVQESGTPTPDSPKAISGVSAVSVVCCQKNFFSLNYLAASGITIQNGEASGTARAFHESFWATPIPNLKFKASTRYTLSLKAYTGGEQEISDLNGLYIRWFYTDGSYTSLSMKNNVTSYTDFTFTSQSGKTVANIKITFGNGPLNVWHLKDIQLEENTEATDFEPFNGSSQIIQLNDTYYGGYVTQDKSGRRQLVVTHNIIDLGSLNWEKLNTSSLTIGYDFKSDGITNNKIGSIDKLCNAYPVADVVGLSNVITKYGSSIDKIGFVATNNSFYVIDSSYSDASAFKTAMSGINLVYELATPYTIDLPDGEPITSLAGVNNVYTSSGSVEVDVPNYFKCASIHATQNSNVVIDTASGSIANFETPLAMPLLDAQIDVNAVQDLHGQSGAYPAGGGINRWDEEWELGAWSSVTGDVVNYTDRIRCKNAIPVLPSTSYCIRFGTTASSVVNAYDENGDFIENLTTGTFGTGGRVITTPANCYFIKFSVGTAYGTTYNNDISVNYPSTDTSYHPYSNICPIDGWDEIKVGYVDFNQLVLLATGERQGLTASIDANGVISLSGVTSGSYSNITQTITNIEAGKIYLIGKTIIENPNNIAFNWSLLNATKMPSFSATSETQWTLIKVINSAGFSTGISGFVAGTNFTGVKAKIICIDLIQALGEEKANYLHGLGDSGVAIARKLFTKDYYPYNAGGTLVSLNDVNGKPVCPVDTIQLNNTYYGGRFIQDKSGKRKFEVTHGISKFDELNWSRSNNGGFWQAYLFYVQIPEKVNGGSLACTNYYYSTYDLPTMSDKRITRTASSKYIYVRDDSYTDIPSFKTANSNTVVLYELAEPYTIDLPDGTPFKSLPGVNNIFADTGDTAVKFRKIGE